MKNIVCLYHDNCVDGFVSKSLIELIHKDDAVISVPVRYGRPITETCIKFLNIFSVINKFILVDFSLPYSDLEFLSRFSKEIIIYDHHDTALEQYSDKTRLALFKASTMGRFDLYLESGICTSTILRDLYKQKIIEALKDTNDTNDKNSEILEHNVENFIDRINDYDVWNLEYDDTFVINETIRCIFESTIPENKKTELIIVLMKNFEKVCLYISSNVNIQIPYELINFVIKAQQIVKDRNSVVKHYVDTAIYKTIKEHKVPFVQCPRSICNYVGSVLSDDNPYVFTYWVDVFKNIVKISLRSNKYKGADVRKIAEEFGGGGHTSAAGIEMSYENFKLFLKLHVR